MIFFLGKCMGTNWLESFFARVGTSESSDKRKEH